MHIRSKRFFSIFIIICLVFSQITLTHSAFAETTRFRRLFGNDRYGTAVEISKSGWTTSKNVVIARGDNFPDALCAGTLAKKYDAPILLTESGSVNAITLGEIKRLGATYAFVVGGVGAISENVVNTLKNQGLSVERIGGADRYETSVKIAEKLGRSDSVAIATGEDFPDALSISAIAANLGMPILLTQRNNLPEMVQAYIKNNAVSKTYVIGGQGVISESVAGILPSPVRLYGSDRYETNVAVIKYFKDKLELCNSFLATGRNFADALTGAVLASKIKRPIILTDITFPKVTEQFIKDYFPENCNLTVIGGTAVVPQAIVDYILNVLKPTTTTGTSSGSTGGSSGGGGGGSTYIAVNSIELSAPRSMIAIGDSLQFTTTIEPSNATNQSIKWSVDGDNIGSIVDGKLIPTKSGIAEVKATTDDGKKSATFKVMVGDIAVDDNEDSSWYSSAENNASLNKRHVSSIKEAIAQKDIVPSDSSKGLVVVVSPGTYNEEAPIEIDRTVALYGPLYNIKTGPGGRYSEEALINFNNAGGQNGAIWPGFEITADNVEINGFTITCSSNSSNPLSNLNIGSDLKNNLTKLMGIMEDNYKKSSQQSVQKYSALNAFSIPTQTGIGIVAFGTSRTNIQYNEMYGMNFGMVLTNISLDGSSISSNNISNNYIHGNRFGFVQGISGIENTSFKNNSIIGNNVDVGNLTAGKMDASSNWWNSGDERDITPLIIDLSAILTSNKYYNVCYFPWSMDSTFSTFVDNNPYEPNCDVVSNDNNDLTASMMVKVVNKNGNVITNLKDTTDFAVSLNGAADLAQLSSNTLKVTNVYSYGTGIYEVTVSAAAPFSGNVDIYAKVTDPKNINTVKNVIVKSKLPIVITGDTVAEGYNLTRISNQSGKEGEADGLDGDRNNSYAWSMAELGDYVYIGTNRNLMLSSALSLSNSGLLGDNELLKDPEIVKVMVRVLSRGDIPTDSEDFNARIFRYNTKTGEIETAYTADGITGYRAAVTFTPKGGEPSVYFGSFGTNSSEILQITTGPATTVLATPTSTTTGSATTVLATPALTTTGSATTVTAVVYEDKNPGSLRAMAVHDDQLYIGGISSNGQIYIKSSSNPSPSSWEDVGSGNDFKDVTYTSQMSAMAGGVWDLISYNGYLYVFISDTGNANGFVVYKGKYVGNGAEGANAAGWKWTEVVGANGNYPSGLGNSKNVTASPFLFTAPDGKTYVYVGTFTSAPQAFIDGLQGNYDAMHEFMNPAQVYRFSADKDNDNEQWEMIVGNPNDYFNADKGNYFAGFYNGSNSEDSQYMSNHYIWRMAVYNNKLFVGTFDAATLYDYVVPQVSSDPSAQDLRKMIDYKPKGFDFFVSEDGINFSRISRNGFDDKYNYGVRTLLPTASGLYIGTANPFYGAQLWKYTDGSETEATTPPATTVKSALSDLQLQDSNGTTISLDKGFNPAQWSYNASVGANVNFIYVIPKPDTNTTVSVGVRGGAFISGSNEDGKIKIDFSAGTAAEIAIKVEDKLTGTTIIYTVEIHKAISGGVSGGDDNTSSG